MVIVICVSAAVVAFLSIFSGFGIGTLLMPVFALFFPLPLAITMTAIVHFLSHILKFALFGRYTNKRVFVRFVIPGVIFAVVGAFLLDWVAGLAPLYKYSIGDWGFVITPVKILIGLIMIGFSLFELLPRFRDISFDEKWLPVGGAISGFFGGVSGNQGAIRAAFLSKAGLTKEVFIGTGVTTAILIDATRLSVYASFAFQNSLAANWPILLAAVASAYVGIILAKYFFKKVTIRVIQIACGSLLVVAGFALIVGLK